MQKAQIGIIGLATMGANLARNFASKKIQTVVFNRTTERTDKFMEDFSKSSTVGSKTTGHTYLTGTKSLKEFISKLETPRKIILMVQAGQAVDDMIEQLLFYIEKDDIILDFGNSFYHDTERRYAELKNHGISLIGCGISGGEEGALHGPSLMPGGDKKAYKQVEKLLEKVAAKDFGNKPCVTYLGDQATGHFVKMVHNGIEYGIMQLIAECYDVLKHIGKFSNQKMSDIFKDLNKSQKSFLLEITSKILAHQEPSSSKTSKKPQSTLDFIKDTAKQKGTGKWTTFAAMDFGVAIPTITNSVDARIISGDLEMRDSGKKFPQMPILNTKINKKELADLVKNALKLSLTLTYIQGFQLLAKATQEKNWNLNLSEIGRIWEGGCIIRSSMLKTLENAYGDNKTLSTKAGKALQKNFTPKRQNAWRKLLKLAMDYSIPVSALYSTIAYVNAFTKKTLPQNLIQAQRDFFGAHGYERTDKPGQFHTEW